MTHLGGVQAPAVVAVVVVTVDWMTSDTDVDAVSGPDVPVTGIEVVVEGAVLETATESKEDTVPPDGGVTGLGLNPPVTPDGIVAERVTGALKPPLDKTVTVIVAVPPGPTTRLLRSAEMLKRDEAPTVKVPLADAPLLPSASSV